MNDLIVFLEVLQPEIARNLFDLIAGAGRKFPVRKRRTPGCTNCVVTKDPRNVEFRINGDAEEMSSRIHLGLCGEGLLEFGEVLGHQRTIVRQRAAGVDKCQRDGTAAILAQTYSLTVLVEQNEIGDLVSRFWL